MNSILIIIVSLLFSAFFSGMEIAFVTANKLRFELDKKTKSGYSFLLSPFFRNPQHFISTMVVGNNIVLVIYGVQMAQILLGPISNFTSNFAVITITQTIISTIIVLFTGELMPKTFFRINPNLWLKVLAIPLWIVYHLLYPVSIIITSIANLILRLLGIKNSGRNKSYAFSRIDLDYWVQETMDNISDNEDIDHEVKIFQNALDFSSVKLRDCMVPRTELVALDKKVEKQELMARFIETGNSKILIYEDSIDNIIGFIHSSEMFHDAASWKERINSVPIVPETMAAHKLLSSLMQQKKSIAVVVDEFGGTAGIVTLEDIMEEIFGEIEDEHDNNHLVAKKIADNEYILSGRLDIDAVNEQFGLDIPESDNYATIAGFILDQHQAFPKLHERIIINEFQFKVLRVTNNRIEIVNLFVEE